MFVLSTKIDYNILCKILFAEPSPMGNIVQRAKRYKKITYFRRRTQPNSLRWNLSNSCILQKSQAQVAFAILREVYSTLQPLSSYRVNLGHCLCNNCRYLPFEQDQDFTGQQFLPANNRLKEFSLCQQSETLPETNRPQSNSGYQQGARSAEVKDVPSQTPHKPLIRPRFFRPYHLWKVHRRSQSRLQSSQKRQAFLPSLTLFRIPHKRLLAWSLKAWRCLYRNWSSRVLERVPCQDPILYLPHKPKRRFRFLRSQIYRASRRGKGWLCRGSQNHLSHKKTPGRPTLSQVQERLGSSRVLLQTLEMEKSSSLCSDTQTATRERCRTAYTFHPNPLCLSGLCNQPSYETSKHLVLLQRPSHYRANYQRTQGRLHFSQDSHKQLSGQSGLFLSTAFRLQYSQLVQENLFIPKIPECYLTDYSHRVFSFASKIGQVTSQECAQIAGRIYLQANIGTDYAQN